MWSITYQNFKWRLIFVRIFDVKHIKEAKKNEKEKRENEEEKRKNGINFNFNISPFISLPSSTYILPSLLYILISSHITIHRIVFIIFIAQPFPIHFISFLFILRINKFIFF